MGTTLAHGIMGNLIYVAYQRITGMSEDDLQQVNTLCEKISNTEDVDDMHVFCNELYDLVIGDLDFDDEKPKQDGDLNKFKGFDLN